MEENSVNKPDQEEGVPYIKREINGAVYTVKIHFREDGSETVQEKVKRLLRQDVESGLYDTQDSE